jgi:hypothetical protein
MGVRSETHHYTAQQVSSSVILRAVASRRLSVNDNSYLVRYAQWQALFSQINDEEDAAAKDKVASSALLTPACAR